MPPAPSWHASSAHCCDAALWAHSSSPHLLQPVSLPQHLGPSHSPAWHTLLKATSAAPPDRPIYAGNAMATFRYTSPGLRMLTVRTTAFQPAAAGAGSAADVEAVSAEELEAAQGCSFAAQWVGEQVGRTPGWSPAVC